MAQRRCRVQNAVLCAFQPGSLFGEQVLQIGEGLRGGAIGVCLAIAPGLDCRVVLELARVLVVVTIQTQQLPVAAVGGIVVVVVVAVMHGQLLQVLAHELARAAATNPRIDLQRLLAVTQFARLPVAQGLGNHSIRVCTLCLINSHIHLLVWIHVNFG